MSDFTIEQLEVMKEGTTPGPWGTMTTGVAGGDHWHVCDPSESLALIATNDGEDEEVRGPNALLMAAAPALVDALIAEKRAHQETLHLVRELWSDVYNHGNVGRASILRHLTRILEADNG